VSTVVVLIEDDAQIRGFLTTALSAHGYEIHGAATATEGLEQAAAHRPQLVIVDLGLPDQSGLTVIARLREWYQRPILVLSARRHENDKVAALDLGADDYLTKPFAMGELLARIRVAERHLQRAAAAAESRIEAGELAIELDARRVWRAGREIKLTPIEYRLLVALARERGRVRTHAQLLREVWGGAQADSLQYLRTFMRTLREKVEREPARPRLLLTEVGIGYRFADEPAPVERPSG
jgi:two-component system KDP operon response regulator KdpE